MGWRASERRESFYLEVDVGTGRDEDVGALVAFRDASAAVGKETARL
jgi:hypothetical protein